VTTYQLVMSRQMWVWRRRWGSWLPMARVHNREGGRGGLYLFKKPLSGTGRTSAQRGSSLGGGDCRAAKAKRTGEKASREECTEKMSRPELTGPLCLMRW